MRVLFLANIDNHIAHLYNEFANIDFIFIASVVLKTEMRLAIPHLMSILVLIVLSF